MRNRTWIVLSIAAGLVAGVPRVRAGRVEDRDGKTVIHVKLFELPDASRTDTFTRSEVAGVRAFVKRFPAIFAEKYRRTYEAHPEVYGVHNWDRVEIELERFTGIQVRGVEVDLLAIAGGLAPDVLYVNFRKSDNYIQSGFLYPLDRPEDGYLTGMSDDELALRVNPKIWPVIRRKGPDGGRHVWAMPYGGALGRVLLFRKDLFDRHNIPYPTAQWTWDDLLDAVRKIADPANGIYGMRLTRGRHESFHWTAFLWSAGGDVMKYDPDADRWRCVFDSREAAVAADFYVRLSAEKWVDSNGVVRRGYAYKDTKDVAGKWNRGEIGMMFEYIDEKIFATIDPELTGMVPVALGPTGKRGGELNSRMMGLFAGIKDPVVRDAAWEYMRFYSSREAQEIKTRVMVEGGLGRFVNPKYLRMFNYPEIERLAPKGWSETFDIAIASGRPEPYGRNSNLAYDMMSLPLQRAQQLMLSDKLPKDRGERLEVIHGLLKEACARANEEMIGIISPRERLVRRVVAVGVLIGLVSAFALVFRRIADVFTPPAVTTIGPRKKWAFRRYAWAYVLLLPAVATIFAWRYVPLLRGSVMAFQDYQLMHASRWVGVDNFGDLLFNQEWWRACWNSLRYSFLVMSLTFIPPIILAILLQEIPRGKLFFRTIYYFPAVVTGIVTVLLWKQFYEPSERGALNAVMLRIPAWGFVGFGAVLLAIAVSFARRLRIHDMNWQAGLALAAGVALFYTCCRLAEPILLPAGSAADMFLGKALHITLALVVAGWAWLCACRLWRQSSRWLGALFAVGGVLAPALTVVHSLPIGFPGASAVCSELAAIPARLLGTAAEPFRWLGRPETAMLSCVIPMVWAGMGPGCLIYLAALKGIPEDFYEAADLDGATFIDKILFVVFPTLKALVIINFIGAFIASWYTATGNILVMTGGSSGTEVAGLHIWYKAFTFLKFGPATAMAWMLGFMLIGFTVHQLRILSRVEFRAQGMTK